MKAKSLIITASLLIVFVLASGCTDTGINTVVEATSDPLDCGKQPTITYETDSCIRAAFKTCTPAKIIGESYGLETTLEIQGLDNDRCAIEYTTVFEANPAKGIAEDRVNKAICRYPASVYEKGEFPIDAGGINIYCADLLRQ